MKKIIDRRRYFLTKLCKQIYSSLQEISVRITFEYCGEMACVEENLHTFDITKYSVCNSKSIKFHITIHAMAMHACQLELDCEPKSDFLFPVPPLPNYIHCLWLVGQLNTLFTWGQADLSTCIHSSHGFLSTYHFPVRISYL